MLNISVAFIHVIPSYEYAIDVEPGLLTLPCVKESGEPTATHIFPLHLTEYPSTKGEFLADNHEMPLSEYIIVRVVVSLPKATILFFGKVTVCSLLLLNAMPLKELHTIFGSLMIQLIPSYE